MRSSLFAVRPLCVLLALFFFLLSGVAVVHAQSTYYFGTDRRAGDTHEDVRQLQVYLNAHGFPLGSSGPGAPGQETNFFGARTYNALLLFQERYAEEILTPIGLTRGTGILGPSTRAFINRRATSSSITTDSAQTSIRKQNDACGAPPGMTCVPGTSIIQPYIPVGGWTPGFGQGGGRRAISVAVSPSTATINTGATSTFSATVENADDSSVTWSASGGSINSSGVFTAPFSSAVSATTTYTVTATSAEDSEKSASASITVKPVVVIMGAASSTVLGGQTKTFTATAVNATSSAVTWSASGGSINSSGVFTAPGVSATTTYTITASSTVDSTKAATTSIAVTPDESFVGWWKLDEGTGSIAYDSSGNGNDGSWSGTQSGDTGYYHTDGAPTFEYSGSFSAGTDKVTITGIDIGEARTIAFWAYIPTLSGTTEMVSKSSSGQGVEVIINSGTVQFYVMGSSVVGLSADAEDITLNAWNHITATYNGANSTMRIYINGEQSGGTATAPGTIGIVDALRFGDWADDNRDFVGRLNDIRMYTELYSAEQVSNLYNTY